MINRRQLAQAFAATVAATVAATSVSALPSAAQARTVAPSGPPTASGKPSLGPIKQVEAGVLDIGYAEFGPSDGPAVLLLHGWPYSPDAYAEVGPLLAADGYRVIVPYLRGYGTTTFLSPDTVRNAQQAAVALDVIALMDALGIDEAVLGGFDWGARTVCAVAALWPERVKALVSVSGYLITDLEANLGPLPPEAELGWWYQYYFATERGVLGYSENLLAFNRLIWETASPLWEFDDATYDRTAAAFDNPDHVDIVIHNYRWRLSLAEGEARYDAYEAALAARPKLSVPSITIASDFDGAAADGAAYRDRFTGPYDHRILTGIGHNVPQEAPEDFARAVVDVDYF